MLKTKLLTLLFNSAAAKFFNFSAIFKRQVRLENLLSYQPVGRLNIQNLGKFCACITLITLLTTSCGFRPLYSSDSGFNVQVREKLLTTLVEVESEEARPEQELKNNLYDLLNPTGLSTEKKYLLKIGLAKDLKSTIIEQDRTITRYSLIYNANYSLINRATGEVIDSGSSSIQGSYDALGSLYTVHIAEGDTSSRVLRELAKDLEMRVGGAFINKPNQ